MTDKILLLSTLVLLLTACGSDDKGTETQANLIPTPPTTYTGIFLDSAVTGLNYITASQSGQTNGLGEFRFQKDEMITFSIGGIELPSTLAALYLTPLELYQTNDINKIEVVNLLRLLQSLDFDGDASNGIEITESTHQLAANLNIDFSASDFVQQTAELVGQSGAANQELISATMAIEHFQLTLSQISNNNLTTCTTTHEKVGHSGFFNTFAHNVSGKATIIDDCTIEITQFSYDGGGPDVYFYGAKNHQYANEEAFPIGQQINGKTFDNASIMIKLPQNKSLDELSGLSVWCVDFAANFGQMEFTP
ncbi:MAG: DM13 domain-containing protein [Colwellia sp.]|uniref:DM13 domain-containing protein n=1 Tax=Colwellia sp. TaxID=56799 RepID=UPI001DDB1184|nr:DM13 domain-containing protein [Colwellia sp.]NQY50978.1 DM13 domain-containing protein [Colwellia sp.]